MTEQAKILQFICENRKSTRTFSSKKVSKEDLDFIVNIASTSPYASGRKNWEITIINNENEIKAIAECVKNKVQQMSNQTREDLRQDFLNYTKSFSFFENAPSLVILTYRIVPTMAYMLGSGVDNEILNWERDTFTKSISCAAMLVLLAAESLGLGACYMTGPLVAQHEIMKIMKAKPGREIGAIIPVGYKV